MLKSHNSRRKATTKNVRPVLTRLQLEQLEDRVTPSVLTVGADINITRSAGNEAETSIAVNPTNTNNLFAIDTNTYQGRYSTDGGVTWNLSSMAGFTTVGGHDAQAVWDGFGNLFVTRLGAAEAVEVGISSNGGANFASVRTIAGSAGTDQPTLATGPSGVAGTPGAVWVSYELGGTIRASGAAVNGLGLVGAFGAAETAPGSTNGDYGGVSIGPAGQVLVNYQDGLSAGAAGGEGPGTISTNLDPDGLGPAGFNARITAHSTNVGGTVSVPPQPGPFNVGGRTIDAEANVAYDNSGGVHNGRVYMAYTDRTSVPAPANNNTDIFVIFSDNNGTNWSAPVRVNDDPSAGTVGATQYLPAIAVDQTTGFVAVSWYDTRNSGSGTTRDTYASVSVDGGATFVPNVRLSAALSNPLAAAVGTFNSGDLDLMSYANGVFYRSWSDNSNSTGDNPALAGNTYDIYTARVTVALGTTDLELTASAATANPVEGGALTYNVSIKNDGTATGSGATLSVVLPAGVSLSSSSGLGSSSTVGNTVTFNLPNITGNATLAGTFTVTVSEEGSIGTQITVIGGDSDASLLDDTTTVNSTVADVAVTINANSGSPNPLAAITEPQSTPANTVVGTFTDPGNPTGTFDADQTAPAPEYTAVIGWGDGTTSTVDSYYNAADFVYTSGGTFQVLAPAHTYAEEGAYTITLTVGHEVGVGTNLVANGGFETGDLSGWSGTGAFVKGPYDGYTPHGNYAAYFGFVGSLGYISQTIPTVPGQQYTFSYYLGSDGQTPNEFQVSWGGSVIFDQTNIPAQGLTLYSFTETATAASTTIQFAGRNDPAYMALDDVSVIAASSAATDSITVTSSLAITSLAETTHPDPANPAHGFGKPGETLNFTSTYTDDPNDGPHTATFHWGDGSPDTAGTVTETGPTTGMVTASHAYAAVGTYTVTETVMDDGSGVATRTFTVSIVPAVGLPIRVDDNNANNNASAGSGNFQLSGKGSAPFFGWTTVSNAAAFDGSEHVHAGDISDTADATWTYSTPATTTVTSYTIYASWAAAPGNATNAAYKIYIDGVLKKTAVVDQTQSPSTVFLGNTLLQSLLTIGLGAGSHNVKVVLSDIANGTVVADGIFDPPDGGGDSAGNGSTIQTGEASLGAQPTANLGALASPTISALALMSAPPVALAPRLGGATAAASSGATVDSFFMALSNLALVGHFDAQATGLDSVAPASRQLNGSPTDGVTLHRFFDTPAVESKADGSTDVATLDQVFAVTGAEQDSDLASQAGPMDAPLLDDVVSDAF